MKEIDQSILIRELQTRVAKLEGGECRLHCKMRKAMWISGYMYGRDEPYEVAEQVFEEWRTTDGGPGS